MKKLKHSKYKNTGILFEMLVRKLTSETLTSNKSVTIDIIKKYFGRNTELSKELQLYNSLVKEQFRSEAQALDYIRTVKGAYDKLNQSVLKRQRYNLVKEISDKFVFPDMSKMHINNYKVLASINMIFEYAENENPKQLLECKNVIIDHNLITERVAPKMIIVKGRSIAESWRVGHNSVNNGSSPWNYYMALNLTNAAAAASTVWNNTAPTSSVFSIGTDSAMNSNTNTYVAYCWAAIAGYSAFGSYTGNGSTDGPFNYVGFRPKFIMLKRTDTTGNWTMYDATRNTYNAGSYPLYPNLSNAEDASLDHFDWLSNGFKMKSTNQNASGGTFIYACFASNPFKNSNAV